IRDERDPRIALHALRDVAAFRPALEAARDAVAFFERWLARPCPVAQLDLVVLPRTGVAGMENTGCIVLREGALVDDEPGEAALLDVLREVLDRHALGTVTSPDLWRALESRCGATAADVARAFAQRPGAPHLAIRSSGNQVEIVQAGDELWTVPVRLRLAL